MTEAHVTGVVADPSGEAVWTFDAPIATVSDVAGLTLLAGGSPSVWSLDPPFNISVTYDNPVDAGDTWNVDPGLCDIVFASGAALGSGSGTVT